MELNQLAEKCRKRPEDLRIDSEAPEDLRWHSTDFQDFLPGRLKPLKIGVQLENRTSKSFFAHLADAN